METVLEELRKLFPHLNFTPGSAFVWSPETQEVIYKAGAQQKSATWSLLHETSHALLEHRNYATDFELLKLEVAAWEKSKQLAADFGIVIDENHIQDCLDTYRDWIYARSICPSCGTKSIQQSNLNSYRCFNCHEVWQVTPSRFARAYRARQRTKLGTITPFDVLAAL